MGIKKRINIHAHAEEAVFRSKNKIKNASATFKTTNILLNVLNQSSEILIPPLTPH